MKNFFKKLGLFFKSASIRWNRTMPKFWRRVVNTAGLVVGAISTAYVPNIPILGDFFAVELMPTVSAVLSYVYVFAAAIVFVGKFTVTTEPAIDKEL